MGFVNRKNINFAENKLCEMKLTVMMFAAALMLAGCKGGSSAEKVSDYGADPKKAESIYSYTPTTGVMVDEFRSDDGWKYVCASALMGVSSEHHRLYSPNGNLRLILGGASEMGGACGWRIDYAENGNVRAVGNIGCLADEEYSRLSKGGNAALEVMKEKLESGKCQTQYIIERAKNGRITRAGGIVVPQGYVAKMYIKEWGPFWISDIDGGRFGFFVSLAPEGKERENGVSLLYCNDRLIAETAHKNRKPTKIRTYNSFGQPVGVYKSDKENAADTAFYDYDKEIVRNF